MPDAFVVESVRKLSRKQLRSHINELLGSLETASPEQRDLISYKADFYIRELDRRRDIWSWVSTRDLVLEVIVIGLIGWEISLSYRADKQQSQNFKDQQAVLTAMQKSTKDTADQLALLKRTTEQMSTSVERNAKAAEASSATAAKSLVISERAYVSTATTVSELKVGEKFKVTNAILNSGRTPAIEFIAHSWSGFAANGVSEEEAFAAISKNAVIDEKTSSKGILGPGQSSEQSVESRLPLSDLELNFIKNGTVKWYVYVEITYDDTFGRHHKTQTCNRYDPDRKTVILCRALNKAD